MFKLLFVFSVLAVSLRNVRALSPEESQKLHAAAFPIVQECSAEFGLTIDDIEKATESGTIATLYPCLIACVFKKGDQINDKGLYNSDKAEEFTKYYLSDEADQKKASEIVTKCKSVNEQDVTDGEKGCERAGLLFECFRPFKDMFEH